VTALAGCSNPPAADSSQPSVLTTNKNFYWLLSDLIGAPEGQAAKFVKTELLIDNDNIDPHEFEPSAKDKLKVANAAAVVYAGTDVDVFVPNLLDSVGFDVSNTVKLSDFIGTKQDSCDSLCKEKLTNPHIWFDLDVIEAAAPNITKLLIKVQPSNRAHYENQLALFEAEITKVKSSNTKNTKLLKQSSTLATYFAPESIANVLINSVGITNATPNAIANKFANGVELSVREMNDMKTLLSSGSIGLFAANRQVETQQAQELLDVAISKSIPIIYFSETDVCAGSTGSSQGFLTCLNEVSNNIADAFGVTKTD
jgi:zinc/manganese transport system substrate-binding protein